MRTWSFGHKRLLIGLAVAAVLLIAAALLVPRLVNLDRYAQALADAISSGIGSPVTIKSGRFAVLPDVSFVIRDMELRELAGPIRQISVPKARIDLDIFPLLFGKVRVEEVHVYDPQILAVRPWQSSVSDKSPSATAKTSNPFSFMKSTDMLPSSLDVTISGGRLIYLDRSAASPATVRIAFNDISADVNGMNSDVPFNVSLRCHLEGKRTDSGRVRAQVEIAPSGIHQKTRLLPFGLSGQLSVRAVPCSVFQVFLPSTVRAAGLSGTSRLDLTFDAQRNGDASLKGSLLLDGLALEQSLSNKGAAHRLNLSFVAEASGTALITQQFSMALDDSKLVGSARIVDPESSDATIECTFSGPRLPIATVMDLLPAGLVPPGSARAMQAMTISGEVQSLKGRLSGKLAGIADSSSMLPKMLAANCRIYGLNVSPAYEGLAVTGLSGNVVVRDGTINVLLSNGAISALGSPGSQLSLESVNVLLGYLADLKSSATNRPAMDLVKGSDLSRASEPILTAQIRSDAPLAKLAGLFVATPSLSPAGSVFKQIDWLEGKFHGICNLVVFLTAPYDTDFRAGLSLSGGEGRWRPLGLDVSALRARATLSPRLAEFEASASLNGQSVVRASAKIADPFSDSALLTVDTSLHASEELVHNLLNAAGLDSLSINGPAAVLETKAEGSYDKLDLSLKTDLSEHEISYDKWFKKKAGISCFLKASATTKGIDELSLKQAQVAIGDAAGQLSGEISHIGSPGWDISAYLGETDVSKLARFCPALPKSGLKGTLAGWFRAFPEGVRAKEAGLPSQRSSSHLCQVGVALTTDGGTINKLLAAQMTPDRLRTAAQKLNFVAGEAKFEATANFPLANPQDVKLGGSVAVKEMQLLHQDLALAVSHLSGKISLAKDRLHVERLTGALGQSRFELRGRAEGPLFAGFETEQWEKTSVDVHLSTRPLVSDLRRIFGATFLQELSWTRSPKVQLSASGNLDDLALDVHVSPRGQVSWGDIRFKPEQAKLAIALAARLEKLARLSQIRGSVQLGSSVLKVTGALDPAQPQLEFKVARGPVRVTDISRLFAALDPNSAAGELILSAKGELGPKVPNGATIYSQLRPKAVSLGLVGAGQQFTDINGSLDLSPARLAVDNLTIKVGQSRVSLAARGSFADDVLQVRIKSPRLNTEDFVRALSRPESELAKTAGTRSGPARTEPTDLRQFGDLPFIGHGTVDASLSIGDFSVGEHDFGRIDLTVPVRDGVLKIENFKTKFCQGKLTLNLMSQFLSKCGLSFEADFKMKKVKLEEFLSLLGVGDGLATGRARVSGRFQGCGGDTDELLKFVRGRFKLKSRDGVIKKFGILSKVFSLLDVAKMLKMDFRDFVTINTPYKLLKCSGTVDKGVLSTRNFVLDASSMKITAVCDIDLVRETIDATIGVFLMPATGNILNMIPILGPVITQRNKTLIPAYFRVHGDLSNPTVRPLPIQTISNQVAKTLQDLLRPVGGKQNGM